MYKKRNTRINDSSTSLHRERYVGKTSRKLIGQTSIIKEPLFLPHKRTAEKKRDFIPYFSTQIVV